MIVLKSLRSNDMDANTRTIVELILATDISKRPDLINIGKLAFLDYVASLLAARNVPKVKHTAAFIGMRNGRISEEKTVPLVGQPYQSLPENAAFFNGFCSHYLDYDDAQANIAGHFSTVLFSTLLAMVKKEDSILSFLTAYMVGAELEGILGSYVNPAHKQQGWHSTGTIGPIGAAAAIAKLKQLNSVQTAELLALGATQSSGMGFSSGTDTKPLHAGFASRNAVFAYYLLTEVGLTSSERAFNNETGWLKTISGETMEPEAIKNRWFSPGQVIVPGLWMKLHPYCSAGICGAAACSELYKQGFQIDDIERVVFRFPPGADKALRYEAPETGQEGRFSMEYVGWQILQHGGIADTLFTLEKVPEEFKTALPKFSRVNDLPSVEKSVRITEVVIHTKDGRTVSRRVDAPLGSPGNPFTEDDIQTKLTQATSKETAEIWFRTIENWPEGSMKQILDILPGTNY